MSYREPDPQRQRDEAERAAREQAEEAAAIAAMKSPFGGRGLGDTAMRVSGGATVVPVVCILVSLLGVPEPMRNVLVLLSLGCGWIGGLTGAGMGVVAVIKSRPGRRWPGALAIVLGGLALPISLVAALAAALAGVHY